MANKNEHAADTTDREIITTRLLDAPRELVFEAFTNPEHVAKWWGPEGFTTTIHQMAVKPGGKWVLTMHGPDGRDYHNSIVYLEIIKPELLSFKHVTEEHSEPATHITTVTFEAQGNKTNLTLQLVFESAAERDRIAKEYKAVEGGKQTLARLGAYLPEMEKQPIKELMITRVFNAPRKLVWEAWTDAKHIEQWWGPQGFTNPVCNWDARAGSMILIHMKGPDGIIYPMDGKFLEVSKPDKLVFTAGALDQNGKHLFEAHNTITFIEEGNKTKVTLQFAVSNATAEAGPHLAGMETGWKMSLDKLSDHLLKE